MHIPSIVYRSTPQTDWPIVAAEEQIRNGKPLSIRALGPLQLGQLGDQGRRRPQVVEFLVVLPGGLHAVHRVNEQGIPASFTRVPAASFAKRQFLAFACSHLLGLNIAPLSFERDLTAFGPGSLTAIPVAEPFLRVDILSPERRTVARRPPFRRRGALGAALVFEALIGSGQRFETSAVCDGAGYVRTTLHHEAWQYGDRDASARIAAALRAGPEVDRGVLDALFPPSVRERGGAADIRIQKVCGLLREHLGETVANGFQERLEALRASRPTCLDVSLMVI